MKHRALWASVLIFLMAATLCRTAIQPIRFTGTWQGTDGRQYIFREGIITTVEAPAQSHFQGAYAFTQDSITLFVTDYEKMDTVKTLYWIHLKEGDILCDAPNGIGTIYFYRSTDDT